MKKLLLLLCTTVGFADTQFVPFFANSTGNNLLTGLVAAWKFDDAPNAADSSGNGFNLTAHGIPGTGTGVVNGDRVYDKSDPDYFSLPTSATFAFAGTSAFTLSCWAEFVPLALDPDDMSLFIRGDLATPLSWWLGLDHGSPDDYVRFTWTTDGTYNFANNVSFKLEGGVNFNWYFVYVRWDGANLYLSVTEQTQLNLAPEVSVPFVGPFYNTGTFPCYIGTSGVGDTTHNMNGDIDEMNVWNRALSACELQKLWTAKAGVFSFPLFDANTCQ